MNRFRDWIQHLLSYLSRGEKITVALLAAVLIISGFLTVVGFIGRSTEVVAQTGGRYREAAVGQPRFLNPIVAGASDIDSAITRLVYSPLFRFDNNLQLQPDLAERYDISTDHTEYTVYLRPNITWHDGTPFTADDVIFTIRSIQTPEYTSPLAAAFQGVETEKGDERTIRFKLKQPYAPFLSSLTVGIVPQHAWSHIPPQNALLTEQMLKPIGTGPFKFSELSTKRKTGEITSLRLVRNESFYGQAPYLSEIIFAFHASADEAATALTSGKVDGLGTVSASQLAQLKDSPSTTLHRLLLSQYSGLFFNQEKQTILKEAPVRAALSESLDRQRLVNEALSGEGEPLQLPIPPSFYSDPELPLNPPADVSAAAKTLDDAGWKDSNSDGVRDKAGKKLEFTITTTDSPDYVRTAELIRDQWQPLGIATNVKTVGAGAIQQTVVRPRYYEILLFGEILPAEPDPYAFWHSTQAKSPGLNFALLRNKEIDTLLEAARQSFSVEDRQQKYHDFQQKILDMKPAIILYRPYYLFATRGTINGITARYADLPSGRFNDATAWYVKTKREWK